MQSILWDTPGTHVRDYHTAKSDPTINPICGRAASRPKRAAAIMGKPPVKTQAKPAWDLLPDKQPPPSSRWSLKLL